MNTPFICPQCGGHHFGTSLDTAEDEFGGVTNVTITEHQCHDQHRTGCKWRGQWPPAAPLRCHPAEADAVLTMLSDVVASPKSLLSASMKEKASLVILRAVKSPESIVDLQQNTFSLSRWLTEAMASARKRDPVDAVWDAELLLGALKLHLEANR